MNMETLQKVIHKIQPKFQKKTENFQLCPYFLKAHCDLFSDHMKSVWQPDYKPPPKLICELEDKFKYMVHYKFTIFTYSNNDNG